MLLADHPHVYAFTRRLDDTELLILANFSGEVQEIDLPDAARWTGSKLLLSNYRDLNIGSLYLRPWESRVHARRG